MRCLNEGIARRANREDGCKGRFWEGRFRSQALLDEAALLTCMTYVDLNPIRAGVCERLEDSDHTSIHEWIRGYESAPAALPLDHSVGAEGEQKNVQRCDRDVVDPQETVPSLAPAELLPFADRQTETAAACNIPFSFADYAELIDWTGRAIRDDKRGAISPSAPPLLRTLGIRQDQWLVNVRHCGRRFPRVLGRVEALCKFAAQSRNGAG